MTELGIFPPWSEHCLQIFTKPAQTLPTKGEKVIQEPGGAGVVDIGDGWAAVFADRKP